MGISVENGLWVAKYPFEQKHIPKQAGFWWHGGGKWCDDGKCDACKAGLPLKRWWTNRAECAARLEAECDANALGLLREHKANTEASKAVDADIDVPSPEGLDYLPYQRAGIAYALGRPNTLIGDEMGLGKTIQALGIVNASPGAKNVLVVCPASLRLNWRKEAERWLVREFESFVIDRAAKVRQKNGEKYKEPTVIPDTANLVIVNYALLRGKMVENPVTDEEKRVFAKASLVLGFDPKKEMDEEEKKALSEYLRSELENLKKMTGPELARLKKRAKKEMDKLPKRWVPSPILQQLMDREWDVLVVDECHMIKNPNSLQAKCIFGQAANPKKRLAKAPGIMDQAHRKVFLTGTPLPNRPKEMHPIAAALAPDQFGNFFKYAKRYCGAKQQWVPVKGNPDGKYVWDFSGASNLEELQERLRASFMVRRLKKDVLTELPPKRRQIIELPADKAAEREIAKEQGLYDRFDDQLTALDNQIVFAHASNDADAYEDAVAALKDAQGAAFAEMSAIRQSIAMAKIPAVIEHLENAFESGIDKIVLFGHHHNVCDAIHAHFGDAAVKLTGTVTSNEARQRAVDRFQSDPEVKLFVGSIGAAGVGHTLTAASTVVFAELSWVPSDISQAEDRCHRIGQKESVLVQHLVLEGSLDAYMAQVLVAKQDVADRALDKDTQIDVPELPKKNKRPSRPGKYPPVPEFKKSAALQAMQMLAGVCDGAQRKDGAGFNALDTNIGRKLATLHELTDGQAWIAINFARKYQGQLPASILKSLDIGQAPK